MAKVNLSIGFSEQMREALDAYAVSVNLSSNEVVRRAVAGYIQYNLDEEEHIERRGRPRKYESEEDRKAAAAERARKNRAQAKEIYDTFLRQRTRRDMEKFRDSVVKQYGE